MPVNRAQATPLPEPVDRRRIAMIGRLLMVGIVGCAAIACGPSSDCESLREENSALREEIQSLRAALADAELGSRADSSPRGEAWPKGARAAYVDRCTGAMLEQTMPAKHARPYCACIASGMENEFEAAEFVEMMRAQPRADGSEYDRRLYDVFTSCGEFLR